MADKIINTAQFKKLYHEDVAKENMSKNERAKAFEKMWNALPDFEEGKTHTKIEIKAEV